MKLYLVKESKGINAMAEFDIQNKKFTVLKNSRVSSTISTAPTFGGLKALKKQREKYVVAHVVKEDVVFKSSSTAGNFVTGNSTNGPAAWKDYNGKSLKSILDEMKK